MLRCKRRLGAVRFDEVSQRLGAFVIDRLAYGVALVVVSPAWESEELSFEIREPGGALSGSRTFPASNLADAIAMRATLSRSA
jgi:hypothetical protein